MKNRPFINRLGFALQGVSHALSKERSFQSQLLIAIVVMSLVAFLELAPIWMALIGLVCFLILGSELMNTAIENLCDLVNPDQDPRVKLIKDLAAGSVLFFSLASLWVAGWVVWEVLLN